MDSTHLFPQRALGKSGEVWGAPERSGELWTGPGRSGELRRGLGRSGELQRCLGGSNEVRGAPDRFPASCSFPARQSASQLPWPDSQPASQEALQLARECSSQKEKKNHGFHEKVGFIEIKPWFSWFLHRKVWF